MEIEDDREYIQLLHMAMVGLVGLKKTLEIIAYAQSLKEMVDDVQKNGVEDGTSG